VDDGDVAYAQLVLQGEEQVVAYSRGWSRGLTGLGSGVGFAWAVWSTAAYPAQDAAQNVHDIIMAQNMQHMCYMR
jgi:hypothetical protein